MRARWRGMKLAAGLKKNPSPRLREEVAPKGVMGGSLRQIPEITPHPPPTRVLPPVNGEKRELALKPHPWLNALRKRPELILRKSAVPARMAVS